MRLLDVIEYTDATGHEVAHKIPDSGPADIRLGAQLTVRESQAAVFFRDGKAMDVFPPGRHTLTTANLPILGGILGMFTRGGDTPFQAEVVFVNQHVFAGQKWGTPHPVNVKDPELQTVVPVRAFGTFSYVVADAQLFINMMLGTRGTMGADELTQTLRASIVTHFNTILATNFKGIAEVYGDLENFGAVMKAKIKDDFGRYGLDIREFFVEEVSIPENIQAIMDKRFEMKAMGTNYQQMSTFDVMKTAANNPGGSGQAFTMGAGLGMGAMMPQMMQNAMGQQQPAPPQAPPPQAAPAAAPGVKCTNCQTDIPAGGKFCLNCGTAAPQAQACANCHQELPPGAKFCMNCGTAANAKATCPNCHQEAPAGARFCLNCGTKMG